MNGGAPRSGVQRGETPDRSLRTLIAGQARTEIRPTVRAENHHVPQRSRSLELHIDQLVLHGFAAVDRSRIGAAVERELGRLLAQTDLRSAIGQWTDRERIDGGAFTAAPGEGADAIGTRIAQAVYKGLAR
jgi:hypothetical protein